MACACKEKQKRINKLLPTLNRKEKAKLLTVNYIETITDFIVNLFVKVLILSIVLIALPFVIIFVLVTQIFFNEYASRRIGAWLEKRKRIKTERKLKYSKSS